MQGWKVIDPSLPPKLHIDPHLTFDPSISWRSMGIYQPSLVTVRGLEIIVIQIFKSVTDRRKTDGRTHFGSLSFTPPMPGGLDQKKGAVKSQYQL